MKTKVRQQIAKRKSGVLRVSARPASCVADVAYLRVTGLPPGAWHQGQAGHAAPMVDVSVGGCFIRQWLDAAPVGGIDVYLKLPPPTDSIRVNATVVHARPGIGFGVQFTELTDTHRQALNHTVASRSYDQVQQSRRSPGSSA